MTEESICVNIIQSDDKDIYMKWSLTDFYKTACTFQELFHNILNGFYPQLKIIEIICSISEIPIAEIKAETSLWYGRKN